MRVKFFLGRRGNVIGRLENGKIVLPLLEGFPRPPQDGETWEVEIDEKERYAFAKAIVRTQYYPTTEPLVLERVQYSSDVVLDTQKVQPRLVRATLDSYNSDYVTLFGIVDGDKEVCWSIPIYVAFRPDVLPHLLPHMDDELRKLFETAESTYQQVLLLAEQLFQYLISVSGEVMSIIATIYAKEDELRERERMIEEKEKRISDGRACPHGVPHKKVTSYFPDELYTHDYEVETSYVIQCQKCLETLERLREEKRSLSDELVSLIEQRRKAIYEVVKIDQTDEKTYLALFVILHRFFKECPQCVKSNTFFDGCDKLLYLLLSPRYRQFCVRYEPFNLEYFVLTASKVR